MTRRSIPEHKQIRPKIEPVTDRLMLDKAISFQLAQNAKACRFVCTKRRSNFRQRCMRMGKASQILQIRQASSAAGAA